MSCFDAVVLAGGKNSKAMREATGVENRALVRLGERTMLDFVLTALRHAESVGRIVVVGDVPPQGGNQVVAPGETLVDNLFRGLAAVEGSRPVLAVTSDIPFLTPESVDDFTARAFVTGADFCYPIIPLALCQAKYPQMRRTSLKVREGIFTGGNLMLLDPRALAGQRETILRAYGARKSPLALGRMLGGGLTLRLLLSQMALPALLPLSRLEAGVSRLLGCQAAAIITDYPEIGTDVDKPEDVVAARTRLDAKRP